MWLRAAVSVDNVPGSIIKDSLSAFYCRAVHASQVPVCLYEE